jgi:putative flippase GtrA
MTVVNVSPTETKSGFLQFAAFVATGSLAAITNIVTCALLRPVMPLWLAIALGYMAGMVVAFVLFQRMIFGNPGTPLRRRIIRFCQVNALGLALTETVSLIMASAVLPALNWTFQPIQIAHLVGVAAPTFSSYFLHKLYTYR